MTSQAKSTSGASLTINGDDVAELTNIGGPKLKAETIDVTNHDSPDYEKEFILGQKDAGEIALEGNFIVSDTDGQLALLAAYNARTLDAYIITSPDGDWEASFDAVISAFELGDLKVNDKQTFRATLKVSGGITISETASTAPSGFVVSVGTLNPVYSGTVHDYVDPVVTGTSSLTFTITAAGQTITLHSSYDDTTETLASGVASGSKTLGAAGTITTFTVTAYETGKVRNIYIVRVSRAAT